MVWRLGDIWHIDNCDDWQVNDDPETPRSRLVKNIRVIGRCAELTIWRTVAEESL